jgi:hypothetical protein
LRARGFFVAHAFVAHAFGAMAPPDRFRKCDIVVIAAAAERPRAVRSPERTADEETGPMSAGDIYTKTPQGVQEVSSRKLKLAPRLRTMLILVDGRQPAFMLKEEAEKVGAPGNFIEELATLGLIALSGPAGASAAPAVPRPTAAVEKDEFRRFCAAKDFMNVSVVNALGIKAFFFTLKLERASTLVDLRDLVDPYREAIARGSGNAEAEVLTRRVRELVA